MTLSFLDVVRHGRGGYRLRHGLQENGAPSDVDVVLSKVAGEFDLVAKVRSAAMMRDHHRETLTQVACL